MEWISNINEKLMDHESKRIFASRVLYSLTGDEAHLYNLGNEFKKSVKQSAAWKNFVDTIGSEVEKRGLVLYGAGAFGRKMINMTDNVKWSAVIDKSPSSESLLGIPVISTEDYFKNDTGETIVISSGRHYEDMRSYLVENGIDEERVIDGRLLYDLTEGKQYFDLEALTHIDGQEIFADVGCCDGMSSVQFLKWCGGNGVCYCFEPDEHNIRLVRNSMHAKNIKENEQYYLIPKGAWNEKGTISFVAEGTGSSHISGVYGGGESADMESIQVTTLDQVFGDKPVTFIKMDIEGAELKALHGAERIIRDNKPKLAICVYHKAEDIREIPEFILSVRPDYQLYLRHYSFEMSETVLYAV